MLLLVFHRREQNRLSAKRSYEKRAARQAGIEQVRPLATVHLLLLRPQAGCCCHALLHSAALGLLPTRARPDMAPHACL